MILSTKEIRLIVTFCNLIHCFLIIGIVLRIQCNLLHGFGITRQTLHQIPDKRNIIGSLRRTHPCTAPIICLWTFTHGIISVNSISFFCGFTTVCQCISHQSKINAPGRIEKAKNIPIRSLILRPLRTPQCGMIVIIFLSIFLRLTNPLLDIFIYNNLVTDHPGM